MRPWTSIGLGGGLGVGRSEFGPVPCVGRGDVVQQEGGIGTALGIHYSDSVT